MTVRRHPVEKYFHAIRRKAVPRVSIARPNCGFRFVAAGCPRDAQDRALFEHPRIGQRRIGLKLEVRPCREAYRRLGVRGDAESTACWRAPTREPRVLPGRSALECAFSPSLPPIRAKFRSAHRSCPCFAMMPFSGFGVLRVMPAMAERLGIRPVRCVRSCLIDEGRRSRNRRIQCRSVRYLPPSADASH